MKGKNQPFQFRSANNARAKLEVCAQDCAGFVAAHAGGADRLELCSALEVGGLTPSAGMIAFAARQSCESVVLIRPRAGNFSYNASEVEVMERDIAFVAEHRLAGVAIGAARPDGSLDLAVLERLRAAAGEMEICLHRVFDLTPDPLEALEQAIELGFARILTSGQEAGALSGRKLIAKLVEQADSRICIVGAGGITPANVAELIATTGLREVHGSCRRPASSKFPESFQKLVRLGFVGVETVRETEEKIVAQMRAALDRVA